jgi:peptide/nickel transport system substrate-binding protein
MTSESTRRHRGPLHRMAVGAAAALTVGLLLTACGGSGSAAASGSISFAEGPGAAPNYIFPYVGCAYFSVTNLNQFQFLMYRPLYWFGLGSSTAVQYPLSPAKAPVFSDGNTEITIHLKGWKFSDGQTVNAQSLMFFLNMYKADPTSYCGYNAGYGIPDELASATGSGNTVTLKFTKAVSPNWILYNYLSELTPMPEAWDKTSAGAASGSGNCSSGAWGAASTNKACKAVEKFLDAEALRSSTYTGKLWQVVDGPWKLTAFNTIGDATFVPNTKYSGPQKAQVKDVYLESFTTTQAEESELYSGKLSLGYVDPSVLPGPAPSLGAVGPNVGILNAKYTLMTGTPWSFNYAPLNFAAKDPKAPLLKQLYIRQALQESINQEGIIKSVDKGYGVPTCSPIPPNTPSSISANVPCAYPYSLTDAKALLTEHGWKIEGGVQTCIRAGVGSTDCGADIRAGTTLSLAFIWSSGSPALDETLNAEVAAWQSIGITVSHSEGEFDAVVQQCDGGSFQICSWGAGWIYAPDYYPSGETLFTPGGSFNPGQYLNAQMTALVTQSVTEKVPLTAYGEYAAQQLPVLYQPNPTALAEVAKDLKGVQPLNPLQNFMPEYLHY